MEIIKKGNKIVECERCGCVMKFERSDVKTETNRIITSNFWGTSELWQIEYIHCPQCDKKIEVGHKWLK